MKDRIVLLIESSKKEGGGVERMKEITIEELIDTYQNLVFSVCLKITGNYFDAQDLTQDTFLSAFRNLAQFDGVNAKSWVCKIATNKSIDFIRAKSRGQLPTEDEFFSQVEDAGDSPENAFLKKESKSIVLRICERLKPPYDEIARLYFYEEKTFHEIAQEQGKNEKTVQTQVYRAKAMLKKIMERRTDNERCAI